MPTNERQRCAWAQGELLERYHDTEWGVPTRDEQKLYELLLLEAFQAGLSWYIILRKRENFRRAFDGFDARKIAAYGEAKIAALLEDAGIVRCRRKIEGAICNAKCFLAIQEEFGGFAQYLYSFTDGQSVRSPTGAAASTTDLSDRMAADLKRRGMRYVGSITLYSYLQAVGVVIDHEPTCWKRFLG
ncbi:MAG: DNA-3-methyladenine glycosylase I [Clostridia bacterium]